MKQVRPDKGMTQEELAELAGVMRQTIGLIEQGDYNLTISLAFRLSKILGKSLDELFWQTDPEKI